MKRLAIITSGSLPIPAVKGGGVETLVQKFIDGNEINPKFKIDVYTIEEEEAKQKSQKYIYTSCLFIGKFKKFDNFINLINKVIYGINRRTTNIPLIPLSDSYHRFVCQKLKSKEYDIILVENDLINVPHISKASKKKVIHHSHYNDVSNEKRNIDKIIYKKIYSFIKKDIVVSDFIYRSVYSVIGDAVEYSIVNNCADSNAFKPEQDIAKIQSIRIRYGIPVNSIVVLFSGRITEEKGTMELIEAVDKVDVENLCLVFAGGAFYSTNDETPFLRKMKEKAHFSNKQVIFTGYIDYKQMPEIWNMADIAVVPTYSVEEASGLVAIEAMLSGKVIIASDSGALPENIPPECGIIVNRDENFVDNLAKAIVFLSRNEKIRVEKGINAAKYSQKFSVESYVSSMMDAL